LTKNKFKLHFRQLKLTIRRLVQRRWLNTTWTCRGYNQNNLKKIVESLQKSLEMTRCKTKLVCVNFSAARVTEAVLRNIGLYMLNTKCWEISMFCTKVCFHVTVKVYKDIVKSFSFITYLGMRRYSIESSDLTLWMMFSWCRNWPWPIKGGEVACGWNFRGWIYRMPKKCLVNFPWAN
jgi:hypothetical protein